MGVLIWYLQGRREAADVLDADDRVSLSAVTYMELVQGMRNADELRALRGTLAGGKRCRSRRPFPPGPRPTVEEHLLVVVVFNW